MRPSRTGWGPTPNNVPMNPIRTLVVDDSAVYRRLLSDAISSLPGAGPAVCVSSGPLALARMASEAFDLVLLDVFMPEMNGPEVLAKIRAAHPNVAVVMVSGATGRDAEVTISSLSAGALDFIPKPLANNQQNGMEIMRSQLQRVIQLVSLRALSRPATASAPSASPPASASRPTPPQPASPFPALSAPPRAPEILLIGVSTGGPRALLDVIPQLPASFPIPILIVQHMPPVFTKSLAEQLDRISPLHVEEAANAITLRPGNILIAPGGSHLKIRRAPDGTLQTRITDDPPVNSCRPSVDSLFQSAAECRLRGAIAVILTGMGEDGANGVAALKSAGPTWCVSQDAASCVVYGMPMAVAKRGLSNEVLPLTAIARRLDELARR